MQRVARRPDFSIPAHFTEAWRRLVALSLRSIVSVKNAAGHFPSAGLGRGSVGRVATGLAGQTSPSPQTSR